MSVSVLTPNEIEELRDNDGALTQKGMVRGTFKGLWEGTKGAAAGALVSAPALLIPVVGPGIFAGGVMLGGAGNAIWGARARGNEREREDQAMQEAARLGYSQNGQLTDEQAKMLAPKKSPLRGVFGSMGAGVLLGGTVMLGAAAVGLATFGTPLLIGAGVVAGLNTLRRVKNNISQNNELEQTVRNAAFIGGQRRVKDESAARGGDNPLLQRDPRLARYEVKSQNIGGFSPAASSPVPSGGRDRQRG